MRNWLYHFLMFVFPMRRADPYNVDPNDPATQAAIQRIQRRKLVAIRQVPMLRPYQPARPSWN